MRSLDEIIRLAEIAKKKDRGTTNAIVISALKPEKREKVEKILSLSAMASIIAQKENPFWETPEADELPKGDIILGRIYEGHKITYEFSLPLDVLTEHVGIFGQSGVGKSFFCKNLSSQLIRKKVPVWFLDFEDEYSDLLVEDPENFYVLDPASLKINLFENPPNAKPLEWFEKLMNVLRESLYLRDGSINMLGEILFQQLKTRGVLEGGQDYPGLKDIQRELGKLRFRINSRNSGYWESLNNRFSDMDKLPMFSCKKGLDFPMLMKKSVVFKIGGLSDYHQNLLVNYLLTYVSLYREKSDDKSLLVLLLDEGHRIINYEKAKRADLAEPISFEAARNFRKRGVALILSDQVPSLIPASWMGNLGTRIVFRLSHGGCIKAISDALAMEQEQRAFIPEMPRRAAILHFMGWKRPFLINIPELSFKRLDRDFVNEFAKRKAAELSYTPYEENGTEIRETKAEPEPKEKHVNAPGVSLLKEEMDYLESIIREPFLPVTERDKRLGISGWKGNKLRERLIRKDVIEKELINTGKRGGIITLVKTTINGGAIAESLGMRANGQKGKGSFTHQFWAHVIKTFYERTGEAKPSIEDDSLGKAADLLLDFGNRKVAVEIAIHDNECSNVSKDLEVGFGEVWVCTETEEMMEKVKRSLAEKIGSEILGKVRFRLLNEFIKRSANIKRNIGAQPVGLRADEGIEEKAEKEARKEKVYENKKNRKKKEENVSQNINKNENPEHGELLTVEEVAKHLSMPLSTVRKWIAQRRLPVVKLGNGRKALVRVRKQDLETWVEKQIDVKEGVLVPKKSRNRRSISFEEFLKDLKKKDDLGGSDERKR
jgi:excisionase family DNA binding protein